MTDAPLPDLSAQLRAMLASVPGQVVLGYSGGLDSTVLLHGLVRAGAGARLRAVHVHHGLSPEADAWVAHCQQQCGQLNVPLAVERVQVTGDDNLEARARAARRAALVRHLGDHDTLWLAQHRDDQAETLLLRLLRGAGSRGLAGMAVQSRWQGHTLLRPLLSLSRGQLVALARAWALDWVEDDSNQSYRFDRNYLRLEIVPRLQQRWPAVARRLSAVSERLQEDAALLDELADLDLARCGLDGERLRLGDFAALAPARQRNVLRGWIARRGLLSPSSVVLQRVLDEVLTAAPDRVPQVTWPEGLFTRYRDGLFLLDSGALAVAPAPCRWSPARESVQAFGRWQLRCVDGGAAALVVPAGEALDIKTAGGGEKLLLRGMHRQVSELWRVAGVPPWQRRQLPLLYRGDRLIAVAGLGVADDCRPAPDQARWQICVEPATLA